MCYIFPVFSCGYSPYENEFRVVNFDANFLPYKELNAFVLSAEYLNGSILNEKYNWEQNITQWLSYCHSPSVKYNDVYKALYQNSGEELHANPFVVFIKNNKPEAYFYLKELLGLEIHVVEKQEVNTLFKDKWESFAKDEYYYENSVAGFSPSSPEFDFPIVDENIAKCKDTFIQKRWAYQAIVTAFYQSDNEKVKALFNTYFTRKNRTWIDNSAQHYFALVSENTTELLLECVEHGYDKLTRNIELLHYQENFTEDFANSLEPTLRSYFHFVKSVRKYGPALPQLEKIHQLNPENKYLNFLINREINKIENWLLTPQVVSKNAYFFYQNKEENAHQENLQNDIKYANQFLKFLNSIQKTEKNALFLEISSSYIRYLLGEKNIVFNPEKFKQNSAQYVQARVVDFMLNFKQKSQSGDYKKDLLFIFSQVNKIENIESENHYWNDEEITSGYMREQLARNLGLFMTQFKGFSAEGLLLTAKSDLPQNNYSPFYGQSFYVNLYEKASVQDCFDIVKIIDDKTSDPYIQFLQKDDIDHEKIHYCNEYVGTKSGDFDKIKILDIAAQKEVSKGNFTNAIAIYETFPKKYWENTCEEMPFVLNVYNAKNAYEKTNQYFNKLTFLKQFVVYLNWLKTHPKDAQVHYYIANAYYALTQTGCFWYLSKPYNYSDNLEDAIIQNQYKKSAFHFEKILQLSKDENLLATSIKALDWIGQLNQKNLSKENKSLLLDVRENCDLYCSYLNALSKNYKSDFGQAIPAGRLTGFQNF